MKTVDRKIKELIASEYNPRKLSAKGHADLTNDLREFGMVVPIVVNMNPERKNVIVGGHQRAKVWYELGHEDIPCIEVNLDLKREKELNIRLNRNRGEFSNDLLMEYFTKDELEAYGFSESELSIYSKLDEPTDDAPSSPMTPTEGGGDDFDKKLTLKLPEETYNLWLKWCERMKDELGYDNDSKAFEFAIIEAMNTPTLKDGK